MLAVVAAVIGLIAVYVSGGKPINGIGALTTRAMAAGPAPNTGQMAAFIVKGQPAPLPAFKFLDATGAERSLADWKGRVVLLNLWAKIGRAHV